MRPSHSDLPFRSTAASALLDALRGGAALLVCLGHWRYLFFVDYPQVALHRRLLFLPYLLCTMGHQAVIVFFVLSGFLIGGEVLRTTRGGRWSWRSYLIKRGVRLWVVLLPALLFGGLLDLAALHLHIAPRLYAGLVNNHITYDVHCNLTWKAFFGNALFLQTIFVPRFGSNSALWSLANEFWYYLLFPLGVLALRGPGSKPRRLALAALCLAIASFIGTHILLLFPVWLLGGLLAVLPTPSTSAWSRRAALVLYCPFFAAVSRGHITGPLNPDLALGAATFLLLWVLLGAQQASGRPWYVALARSMAGFSYTLYLVHTPVLMFLAGLLAGGNRWQPSGSSLAKAAGVLGLVIGFCYLFASGTEFHTAAVRNWAISLSPGRRPSPDAAQRDATAV